MTIEKLVFGTYIDINKSVVEFFNSTFELLIEYELFNSEFTRSISFGLFARFRRRTIQFDSGGVRRSDVGFRSRTAVFSWQDETLREF